MPKGLLYSQVGYEPSMPVRVILRGDASTDFPTSTVCRLNDPKGAAVATADFQPAGECWGIHWWVAEFPAGLPEGDYGVTADNGGQAVFPGSGLRVKRAVLWDSTVEIMATEMLEIRSRLAPAGCGWQDAGGVWQESNTQSAMIIALADLLEFARHRLSPGTAERIYHQIAHGCEYLIQTQEEAAERKHPGGALSHDLLGHKDVVLPNDALKAVVAWRRAARFLPDAYDRMRNRANAAADKAFAWLRTEARPMGAKGMSLRQRGLPPGTAIPADEWQTRDLLTLAWGAIETYRAAQYEAEAWAIDALRKIADRQITEDQAEAGFHGHFREYDSLPHSEKSWCHSIYAGEFGADAGGAFPNYLVPFVEALRLWPGHEDAPQWRETLRRFATGYLLPACRANPFLLTPYGIVGDEGAIGFAGPWHGFNCVYAYTAALALDLSEILGLDELKMIAHANLQWIAGLNAGLTAESLERGSHIYREDLAPGEAVPRSMIHGIGNRSAGTWFATRGVICNGFATGDQFKFDTDPTRAEDGPRSFTDEDWIVHTAAWLSALARMGGA
ncbi:MAG: hypothetical protein ACLFSZ_07995 [Puniceicoccaceae bacterium]